MSHTHGNGGNRKECTTANSGRMMEVPAVTALIRPEHGKKTRTSVPSRTTPLPMRFLVFLALQAAFFGCIAWTRICAPGLQKALASSADAGVPALRPADSKTIGSGLGPALVQEVLKQLGSADGPLRKRSTPKNIECRVRCRRVHHRLSLQFARLALPLPPALLLPPIPMSRRRMIPASRRPPRNSAPRQFLRCLVQLLATEGFQRGSSMSPFECRGSRRECHRA